MKKMKDKSKGRTCQLKKKEKKRWVDNRSLNHGSMSLISNNDNRNANKTVRDVYKRQL